MADLKVLFSSIANSLTANGKIDAQEAKMANDLGLAFVIAGMSEDDFTKAAQENQAQVSESDADIQQLMENISKKAAQVKAQNTAETTSTPSSEEPSCLTPPNEPEQKELKPDRVEWTTENKVDKETGERYVEKIMKIYENGKLTEQTEYRDYEERGAFGKIHKPDGEPEMILRTVYDEQGRPKECFNKSYYACDNYRTFEYVKNGYIEKCYELKSNGEKGKFIETREVRTDETGKPLVVTHKDEKGRIKFVQFVDEGEEE